MWYRLGVKIFMWIWIIVYNMPYHQPIYWEDYLYDFVSYGSVILVDTVGQLVDLRLLFATIGAVLILEFVRVQYGVFMIVKRVLPGG